MIVAGDFNDWGAKLRTAMNAMGLRDSSDLRGPRTLTYPSRLPVAQLDFIYARGLKPVGMEIPRGRIWWRMSDHLPLVTDLRRYWRNNEQHRQAFRATGSAGPHAFGDRMHGC